MPTNPIPTTSNLEAYWKADTGLFQDTAGTTPASANGDPVGRWNDQSSNAFHLTQATAGNRPTLTAASTFKSQPSVSFLGSSAQFLTNATFNKTSNQVAGTWMVAYQSGGAANGTQWLASTLNGSLTHVDDSGVSRWYHHAGNNEYCSFNFPRPATGKIFFGNYLSTGATNADKLRQRMNTFPRTVTYSATILGQNGGLAVGAGLWLGRHWSASSGYLTGQILEAAYFSRDLTLAEMQAIETYLENKYFLQGLSNAHCLGDSLAKGYPDNQVNGLDWPTLLATQLGSGWTTENHGITAYKTAQIEPTAVSQVDSDRNEWRVRDVVIHASGTNDLATNQTASQAITDMTTSVTNRHAQGFPLVGVVTLTPRQDYPADFLNGATVASFETQRALYNSSLLSGSTGADFVIDLTGDSRFNDCTNTTYFNADKCHWTAALNAIFAGVAAAKIRTLAAAWSSVSRADSRSSARGLNRGLERGVA